MTMVIVPPDAPQGAFSLEPHGLCCNCNQREATEWWIGDGGILGFTHGMKLPWCLICVTEKQLDYARECAVRIPDLEKKLAELSVEGAAG